MGEIELDPELIFRFVNCTKLVFGSDVEPTDVNLCMHKPIEFSAFASNADLLVLLWVTNLT